MSMDIQFQRCIAPSSNSKVLIDRGIKLCIVSAMNIISYTLRKQRSWNIKIPIPSEVIDAKKQCDFDYIWQEHSEDDWPSVEYVDCPAAHDMCILRAWKKEGLYHRDGSYAVERNNGECEWYVHGERQYALEKALKNLSKEKQV